MTGRDPDDREERLEQLAERTQELRHEHQELRVQRAEAGDLSARVHEEAARVHEELGERSLLDPAALREHAERDRQMAAQERADLAREQAEDAD